MKRTRKTKHVPTVEVATDVDVSEYEPGTLFDGDASFELSEKRKSPSVGEHGLVPAKDQGKRLLHDPLVLPSDFVAEMQREGTTDELSTLAEAALSVGITTWNAQRFGYPGNAEQWDERRHIVHCLHWMFEANPWLDLLVAQELSNLQALRDVCADVARTLKRELSFEILDAGPFLFTLDFKGGVAAPEWYPILARRGSPWKVAGVYVHARLGDGSPIIRRCDEAGQTNKAFWWEKPRVFRPVVVYHLFHAETRHEIKVGVVHTTPDGMELARPEDFQQILPVVEYMAQHPTERWVLTGDFYLPPESVVSAIQDHAASLLAAYKEKYQEEASLLLPDVESAGELDIVRLARLLCDEGARLLALIQSTPFLLTKRPERYRSYVLSAIEYQAADQALAVLCAWLVAKGFAAELMEEEDELKRQAAEAERNAAVDALIEVIAARQNEDSDSVRNLLRLFQDERYTTTRHQWAVDHWQDPSVALVDEAVEWDEIQPTPALVLLMRFVERVFTRLFQERDAHALCWAMADWNAYEVSDFCVCYGAALPDSELPSVAQGFWTEKHEEIQGDLERWYARHVVIVEARLEEYAAAALVAPKQKKPKKRARVATSRHDEITIRTSAATKDAMEDIGRGEPVWYGEAREPRVPSVSETEKAIDEIEGRAPDAVFYDAEKRIVQVKRQRFSKGVEKDVRAASGKDPHAYPIAPEPDERRFRNVFGLTFAKELQSRGLDVLAPVSSTNLKSHFSIRFGMHWSSRLADFSVIRPSQWEVKVAGLMSPELSVGTGGLVPVDSEGHWALWCWLHLSDHAPSGVFLSTSRRQQKTADEILDGLGKALADPKGLGNAVSEREMTHRSENLDRCFVKLIELFAPCLATYQKAFASQTSRSEMSVGYLHAIVVVGLVDDRSRVLELLELSAAEALAGFLGAHLQAPLKVLYGAPNLAYRQRVAELIGICHSAIAERMGQFEVAVRITNSTEAPRVIGPGFEAIGWIRKFLCTPVLNDEYVLQEDVDGVLREAMQALEVPPQYHAKAAFFGWVCDWLAAMVDMMDDVPADAGEDLVFVRARVAEMQFLFAVIAWLVDELVGHGGEEVREEHFSDEMIARTYPDGHPRRGPGRYLGRGEQGSGGKGEDGDDDEPKDENRRGRKDRDEDRSDKRKQPESRRQEPRDDRRRPTQGAPKVQSLGNHLVLPRFEGLPMNVPTTTVPVVTRTVATNEPCLQLDEGWIGVTSGWGGTTRLGQTASLKKRKESISLASITCASQVEKDACGIFSLINARELRRVTAGLPRSGWFEVRKATTMLDQITAEYRDPKWDELKAAKKQRNGLFLEHLTRAVDTYGATGVVVVPPFSGDGVTLEYEEGGLPAFIGQIKQLHASSGSFVIIGGNDDDQHWRAAVIHRYVLGTVRWEILIADSELNAVLAENFGRHIAKWIDAPDEMLAISKSESSADCSQFGI